MNSIGGYFELELNNGKHFHHNGVKLNTGRNALEYILLTAKYTKVYIPLFTCDVILEPILKLNIEYEFYSIDSNLEPIFNFNDLGQEEGFIYTNYFGIKDYYISKLISICENVIIDNAQSFFSKPIEGVQTFYSARKFFGVPDGAYVYPKSKLDFEFDIDSSTNRLGHLIKRIENGAKEGYLDFTLNEKSFINQPIREMSKFTNKLLKAVNYDDVIYKRKRNFNYLHQYLGEINEIKIDLKNLIVPMVYPFLKNNNYILRNVFLKNKVYLAKYWPNVLDWSESDSIEYYLVENILAIPIDHRYSAEDMDRILNILKEIR